MQFWRPLTRNLTYVGSAALLLLLLAFIAVQIQQHLFRHRAERLLADFHSIHLHETTWAEAQALMERWKKYGHADGPCDASSCGYLVVMPDPNWNLYDTLGERWNNFLIKIHYYHLNARLGNRNPRMFASIVVQDGKIVRSSIAMSVEVPPWHTEDFGGYGYILLAAVQSRSTLTRETQDFKEDGWVLGNDEQLDDHPDYKVGRPGGCTSCEEALVTFTPFLNQAEVVRLSNFTLDCITRLHPCTDIGDLLPTAKPFHLYHEVPEGSAVEESITPPCRTPPRAIGRDANFVYEVSAISTRKTIHPADFGTPARPAEVAKVRILKIMKGTPSLNEGITISVEPFNGYSKEPVLSSKLRFVPGHRYLLRIAEEELYSQRKIVDLDRCGVLEDTPENLAELQLGFAQAEKLRRPQSVNLNR